MSLAWDKWLRHGGNRLIWIPLLALGSSNVLAQTNKDYLKALQGEAETVTIDSQTRAINIENQNKQVLQGGADSSALPGSLVGGLSIDDFERVLKQSYIGSFLFYKHLNSAQKKEVFEFYQTDPDPDSVRKKILQLSKEK